MLGPRALQHHTQLCAGLLASRAVTLGTLVALIVVGSLVAWKFGSIALRILGILFCAAALASLAFPGAESVWTGLGMLMLGLILWLAGHWLFALRRHYFRSALAEQLFVRFLPSWFDPTRHWNVITVDIEHSRRG